MSHEHFVHAPGISTECGQETGMLGVFAKFQRLMSDHGIVFSISRFGSVWDNAVMKSFFILDQDVADDTKDLSNT